jgi:hypothetical protein
MKKSAIVLIIIIDSRIPDLRYKHQYHKQCLIKWLKKKENCPYCRTSSIYDIFTNIYRYFLIITSSHFAIITYFLDQKIYQVISVYYKVHLISKVTLQL